MFRAAFCCFVRVASLLLVAFLLAGCTSMQANSPPKVVNMGNNSASVAPNVTTKATINTSTPNASQPELPTSVANGESRNGGVNLSIDGPVNLTRGVNATWRFTVENRDANVTVRANCFEPWSVIVLNASSHASVPFGPVECNMPEAGTPVPWPRSTGISSNWSWNGSQYDAGSFRSVGAGEFLLVAQFTYWESGEKRAVLQEWPFRVI